MRDASSKIAERGSDDVAVVLECDHVADEVQGPVRGFQRDLPGVARRNQHRGPEQGHDARGAPANGRETIAHAGLLGWGRLTEALGPRKCEWQMGPH